jgi:TP901 family phage tail tape measure protein
MATIGNLTIKLGLDASGLEKGLASAQRSLRNAGRTLRQTGAGLTLGLSAPLAGIATMALSSAADFETSMNTIQVVSGATGQQMAAMSEQALHLGAVTSFSAGEAAAGMLELAKAGLSVEQTQAAIAGTMDLAAAGNLGLAQAAEITANSLNAFGMEASAAGMVADVLAAAANSSSVEVTDMADAMKMVGTVAAQNRMSFQDTATALAILGNNALKGSDAGTSLKTMLMRLTAPTDAAAGVLADFGVQIYDANGNILPFINILRSLNEAFDGVDDATRNAAMATLFGADAIRAANILIDNADASWDAMSESVNASGAASEVANARMKGLGGAIEYFKGTIDSLLIGSALPFMETLSGMVRGAADFLSGISSLPPQMQQFGAVLLVVVAAAGPLLMMLGTMATALAGLLTPVGLVIAAVAVLGVAWATNFGGIQTATLNAFAAIQPAVTAIISWFTAQIPAALATGQAAWTSLSAGVTAAWGALMAALEPAFARIGAAFAAMPAQMGPLQSAFGGLVTAITTALTPLQPALEALGAVIANIFGVIAIVAVNNFGAVISAVIPAATIVLNQLTVMVNLVATVLQNLVTLVVALFTGDWPTAFASAQTIGQAFTDALIATWTNLSAMVGVLFGVMRDTVVNTLTDMGFDVDAILATLSAAWTIAWESLKEPLDFVIAAVAGVRKAIDDFVAWITGVDIPNPFAGWSFPSLPDWMTGGGQQQPGQPGRNALGTPYWPGGWTWVGERGPELVNLRGGAAIEPVNWAAAGAGGGNLVIESVTINNGMDIEELAYKIFQIRQKRNR